MTTDNELIRYPVAVSKERKCEVLDSDGHRIFHSTGCSGTIAAEIVRIVNLHYERERNQSLEIYR